jgi:hypothetical protein
MKLNMRYDMASVSENKYSGVGVIEGNKIDWWKFQYLLNIIGAT